MANLMDTIRTMNTPLFDEILGEKIMCFITTNGVVIGKPINVKANDDELSDVQDITKFLYSASLKISKELIEKNQLNRNLKETILIENARYKIGNVNLNLRHLVLNVSQIVCFYTGDPEALEYFLDNLS